MVSEGPKSAGGKRLLNELKKLECSVNYDRKEGDNGVGLDCRGKGISYG